ncbi:hypothetical protein E2C01_066041 [Portunus trituberculatus]|uniref:Uncharacterized protein n=1 Tax=Portunus trituberculatus TaxID=210409 RepID=A0A5B7HQ14_PORTR|nr:hypothetical protein [Portunus trituberculatus]
MIVSAGRAGWWGPLPRQLHYPNRKERNAASLCPHAHRPLPSVYFPTTRLSSSSTHYPFHTAHHALLTVKCQSAGRTPSPAGHPPHAAHSKPPRHPSPAHTAHCSLHATTDLHPTTTTTTSTRTPPLLLLRYRSGLKRLHQNILRRRVILDSCIPSQPRCEKM